MMINILKVTLKTERHVWNYRKISCIKTLICAKRALNVFKKLYLY